jgi:hypothetical protein
MAARDLRQSQAWEAFDRLLAIRAEASISGACLRHGAYQSLIEVMKSFALTRPKNSKRPWCVVRK